MAERPAASCQEDPGGQRRAPDTLSSSQEDDTGCTLSRLAGDSKVEGGKEEEGADAVNGSASTTRQTTADPRTGPKETSSGSRRKSAKLCTQGRRSPCISTGWGELAEEQPCWKGPRGWGRSQLKREPTSHCREGKLQRTAAKGCYPFSAGRWQGHSAGTR